MKPLGIIKLNLSTNRRLVGTAAAVGAGVTVCAVWRANVEPSRRDDSKRPNVKLPAPLVDGIAGALGEIAQILVLYPLDTIKVRCQATEATANVVVQRMLRRGVNFQLIQKLYAGALGAAACAVLVGAVHFASYEGARKAFLKLAGPGGTSAGAPPAAPCSCKHHHMTWTAGETLSAAPPGNAYGLPEAVSVQPSSGASCDTVSHQLYQDDKAGNRVGRTLATLAAAVVTAVATALVESPVELFRHNAQAGLVHPNFLREMLTTVRREGVGGLYWGFLPHCFEAWPHDTAELAAYGFMGEFREAALRPGCQHHSWMAGVSNQGWDLATGAAAGATAVLVSMPFDTVKTYLQTHGAELNGRGMLGSAKLFVRSAQHIVSRKGLPGLYVGVTPRLLQQVPSAMLCWWTIAAFKRSMEPYTIPEEGVALGSTVGTGH